MNSTRFIKLFSHWMYGFNINKNYQAKSHNNANGVD